MIQDLDFCPGKFNNLLIPHPAQFAGKRAAVYTEKVGKFGAAVQQMITPFAVRCQRLQINFQPIPQTLLGKNTHLCIEEQKLIILDEPETGLDFHNQILVLNMVERLAHEEGISAIMNTHYPTNAISVADEALMLNRKGEFFYGPAAAILNEQNISYSFDVQVIVDELNYQGRAVRSIVPVALRGNAV